MALRRERPHRVVRSVVGRVTECGFVEIAVEDCLLRECVVAAVREEWFEASVELDECLCDLRLYRDAEAEWRRQFEILHACFNSVLRCLWNRIGREHEVFVLA